ncbi:EAL and GGDEF domain-containing protein [Roseibium sp.]|uniref:sensor domain-containing protein n=1 Tax=Roseibium sp. TaxID=1936156 RepID=UPI003B522D36
MTSKISCLKADRRMTMEGNNRRGDVADWQAIESLASGLEQLNATDEFRSTAGMFGDNGWLRALLNDVSDYVYVKDRRSRFVMANKQVALDMGLKDSSDLIGKSDLELHPSHIGSVFYSDEQAIMETGTVRVDFEERVLLPDGTEKWFSSSKYPIPNAAGEVVGIVGISRDITGRQKAEQLLAGQNQILKDIVTGVPLSDVLETLVYLIEGQLDGVMGSVMLLDETGEHISPGAGPNLPEAYLDACSGIPIGPRAGSCGTAAFRKEDVFVEDIFDNDLWADFIEIMQEFDLRSCWSVPFFSNEGEVLGTFAFYTTNVRSPSEREIKIAHEAAHLASIAVGRDLAEQRIRYLAHHDPLTGLPNRQEFKAKLEEKVETSRKTGEPVAVVFVDMDNFKFVNDSYGHTVGDEVLTLVSQRIVASHNGTHETIRFGGDEFVLIVDGPSAHKPELKDFLSDLRNKIIETIHLNALTLHVTCSIGAAVYPFDGDDAEDLLKNADDAMFEAKNIGRDSFFIYDSTTAPEKVNRLKLIEDLRHGISCNELFLEYQPQIDLMSGRIIGAEALVRWNHPQRGRLMPGDFIEIAEETGAIVPLGRWVLNEACRQNKAWQKADLPKITISVNVSAVQFKDTGLISDISGALDSSGLDSEYLEIEFTESLLIQNVEQAIQLMEDFRRIGIKLAIDDFGTGYSSLVALKNFPLTRLKIDQSFIQDLEYKESDRAIVRAIIALGRELGLNVVAEGVETAKQQAFLLSCRCETTQGYHFGRPMAADKFAKLLGMTRTPLDVA